MVKLDWGPRGEGVVEYCLGERKARKIRGYNGTVVWIACIATLVRRIGLSIHRFNLPVPESRSQSSPEQSEQSRLVNGNRTRLP